MEKKIYPDHIYENIRIDLATSYIKHEFRKLLWRVPEKQWKAIDKDIGDWMENPELTNPRDFWNGFYGICTGFKLKIGLVYFVTAENISWMKKEIPIIDLWFGVDLQQTRVVGEGKLPASQIQAFYNNPKNKKDKDKQLTFTLEISGRTASRDKHPIIVVQKEKDRDLIYSTYDGNRRLAKAILEGKDKINAFIGSYTTGKQPKNYWIPTTILMENLLFAKQSYERGDEKLFGNYVNILRDMVSNSESAKYELKNRALTSEQPFRDEFLKALNH